MPCHLRHGTPHVHIEHSGAGIHSQARAFGHDLWFAAEKLHADRRLFIGEIEEFKALLIFVMQRFGADHLGHFQADAVTAADETHGFVGDAGHGCQHKGIGGKIKHGHLRSCRLWMVPKRTNPRGR